MRKVDKQNITIGYEAVCCVEGNCVHSTGANLGFWKGGSEHRSGSLKQGVWGRSPPEATGFFLFIAPKSCQNARFKDMTGPELSVRPVRQVPDHFSEAIPLSKSLS